MDYKVFILTCQPEHTEIFVAELAELGFDTMQETDSGIEAFSEEGIVTPEATTELLERYSAFGVSGEWKSVENTNWNEEWEKNYEPVIVEDLCVIRADFHAPIAGKALDLIINPRMSFGTGHHATTYLMVKATFALDLNGKSVLDAGCGTGVLAILAEKRGASSITAYDVSQLCSDNTLDNLKANNCGKVKVYTGVIEEIPEKGPFDLIYANINKNVLLDEIAAYRKRMHDQSTLLLSGFFTSDADDLAREAALHGLKLIETLEKDGWACMKLAINLR